MWVVNAVVKGTGSSGVFFFKQKTAYEMLRSLVGSEMCIRDRGVTGRYVGARDRLHPREVDEPRRLLVDQHGVLLPVSYTHLTLPTIYPV